jgi:hypothetical protein
MAPQHITMASPFTLQQELAATIQKVAKRYSVTCFGHRSRKIVSCQGLMAS